MQSYYSPEDLARHLEVPLDAILKEIEGGRLRALLIGGLYRIPESALEDLMGRGAGTATAKESAPRSETVDAQPDGVRWCRTRSGRSQFRVEGTVAGGVAIWPGKMLYPIRFPASLLGELAKRFGGSEFPVGGTFDAPTKGSLGEFIQQRLEIKMNPAVYLAALLIDEDLAVETRRGYLKLTASGAASGR